MRSPLPKRAAVDHAARDAERGSSTTTPITKTRHGSPSEKPVELIVDPGEVTEVQSLGINSLLGSKAEAGFKSIEPESVLLLTPPDAPESSDPQVG